MINKTMPTDSDEGHLLLFSLKKTNDKIGIFQTPHEKSDIAIMD